MSTPEKKPDPAVVVAMPPAPPGEVPPEAVARVRAVSDALMRLGDQADTRALAAHIKATDGLNLRDEEIAAIRRQLLREAPPPAQPGKS